MKLFVFWLFEFETSTQAGKGEDKSGNERSKNRNQSKNSPVEVSPGKEIGSRVEVGDNVHCYQDNAEDEALCHKNEMLKLGMVHKCLDFSPQWNWKEQFVQKYLYNTGRLLIDSLFNKGCWGNGLR